jgi:hypothetical protein
VKSLPLKLADSNKKVVIGAQDPKTRKVGTGNDEQKYFTAVVKETYTMWDGDDTHDGHLPMYIDWDPLDNKIIHSA